MRLRCTLLAAGLLIASGCTTTVGATAAGQVTTIVADFLRQILAVLLT
jgi:hypothetical protein